MGITQSHVRAPERVAFVEVQSGLDTMSKATSTGALKILKLDIEWDQKREDRRDNRATRGRVEGITGQDSVKWSMETYVNPSGAAGTAPDCGELLQSFFGVETVSGGVSVTYSPFSSQAQQLLSIHDKPSSFQMQSAIAAWVDTFEVSASGADPLKFAWTGGARRAAFTGFSTLNADITSSTTAVGQTIDADMFEPDSVVQVGSNTNTSAGYRVTAKAQGSPSMTLETSITSATTGDTVQPYTPTETTAGRPLAGIDGSVTLNGTVCPVTGFKIKGDNGQHPLDGEYGTAHVSDVVPGWRTIDGEITFRLRKDQAIRLANRKNNNFAAQALSIVTGSVAGRILTNSLPQVELKNVLKIEHTDDGGPSSVTMGILANESAVGANDAWSQVWT